MKEITRIHLAKVAYDVELAAKKDLDAYLKMLETYSHDTEIIEDIEIRITEILAERGVKKGGVITEKDVVALKQQLGEPREFMTDGDIAVGQEDEVATGADSIRKLYRNTDNAVAGGVLSGMASFFKIDAVWMRLAFIVLLFVSFGAAVLVYLVLWVVVPPARTAADKLQMAGRAVTVGSIRELNENEASRSIPQNRETTKRVLTTISGILCIIGATATAMGTAAVIFAATQRNVLTGENPSGFFIAAFVLAVISGLLLTVLFILGAYASFVQKMTRRILIAVCAVIVLGLVSFGTAIGFVQYGAFERNEKLQANTHEQSAALPSDMATTTALMVNDAQNMNITYTVTTDKPSATLRTVERDGATIPAPKITMNKGTLQIDVSKIQDKECDSSWWCDRSQQELIIRGPALNTITTADSANVTYLAKEQDALTILAEQNTNVAVSSGTIRMLKVTAREDSSVRASVATIQNLEADVRMSAQVEVGTVQTLIVNDLNSCPSQTREALVSVSNVTSGTMTLNGTSQPAKSIDTGCTEIAIEGEENE